MRVDVPDPVKEATRVWRCHLGSIGNNQRYHSTPAERAQDESDHKTSLLGDSASTLAVPQMGGTARTTYPADKGEELHANRFSRGAMRIWNERQILRAHDPTLVLLHHVFLPAAWQLDNFANQ